MDTINEQTIMSGTGCLTGTTTSETTNAHLKNLLHQLEFKNKILKTRINHLNTEVNLNSSYKYRCSSKDRTLNRKADRRYKIEPQLFEAVTGPITTATTNIAAAINLPTVITTTTRNINQLVIGPMTTASTNMGNVTGKINNFLNIAEDILKSMKDKLGLAGVSVSAIFELITIMYEGYKHNAMALYMIGFKRILALCGASYTTFLEYLGNYQTLSCENIEPQAFDHVDNLKLIFSSVAVVVSMLLRGKNIDYGSISSSLSDFGRSAIGFTKLQDLVVYIIEYVKNEINKYKTGMSTVELAMIANYPALDDLYRTTRLLTECPNTYIDRSAVVCKHIIATYKQWETFQTSAIRNRDTQHATIFGQRLASLRKRYDLAIASPAMLVMLRKLPMCVYLYGGTGTGKTILQKALIRAIWKKSLQARNIMLKDCVYPRKVENDYWDGYRNQPILLYDDMLQLKDTIAAPNPEFMEIIRVVNEDTYQLHMADVADKKNTFLDSEYVICSSNMKLPKSVSLNNNGAFCRRLHMCADVKVHPDFATHDGQVDVTKLTAETKLRGLSGTLQTFHYQIDIYDPVTGGILQKDLTYDEFIDRYFERLDEVLGHSERMNEDLRALAGISTGPMTDALFDFEKVIAGVEVQGQDTDEHVTFEDVCSDLLNVGVELSDYTPETCSYEDASEVDDPLILEMIAEAKATTPSRLSIDIIIQKIRNSAYTFSNTVLKMIQRSRDEMRGIKEIYDNIGLTLLDYAVIVFSGFTFGCGLGFISKLLYQFGISLFTSGKVCATTQIKTFKDAAKFVPCERKYGRTSHCKCTFYDVDRDLETYEHPRGVGILKSLIIHPDTTEKERVKYVRILTHEFSDNYQAESGEIQTRRNFRNVTAESNETQTRRNYKYMTAESNELQTQRSARKYTTENKSFDDKCIKLNNDVFHNGELELQTSDVVQVEQLGKIAFTNLVCISSTVASMNAVFVTGTTILVPAHFCNRLKGVEYVNISNPYQEIETKVRVADCQFHRCTDIGQKELDLVLMALPRCIPSRPNIIGKFAIASHIDNLNEGEIVVACYRKIMNKNLLNTFTTPDFNLISGLTYEDKIGNSYRVHKAIGYDIATAPGDCGGIVFAKNNLIANKIVGIHVAGYKGMGLSLVVSRELLERNLTAANFENKRIVDGRIPFAPEMKENSILHHGDCIKLGELQQPRSSTKSQISRSLIHGAIGVPTMKPAYLRPFELDGEQFNPMRQGIKKVLGAQSVIPPKLLNIASNDVQRILDTDDCKPILTYAQAVEGVLGIHPGINRRTSPGYPYCLNNPSSGKHHWFGSEGPYIINEEIQIDVEKLINSCRDGRRGDVVFLASLKDERRPIEKVNAGKTRVFEAAPMHYVIAVRMYFLSFIQSLTENRISNEIAVGTNVYSMDWERIAQKVMSKGNKIIAGDFSNFDGSLNQEILWEICNLINCWYDDGPINKRIREVLWEEVCNTNVLVEGELIRQTHSQPSGNPLTVIINSIFNMIVMRMAYVHCKAQKGMSQRCDFTQHVGFVTYGDDNIFGVSDEMIDIYNQNTITESLATIGLTYTDEAKSGILTPYRTLAEVEFLKRKFVPDENGYHRAPLRKDVILEMTNWIKGKNYKASTIENIETSLRELAIHGQKYYETSVAQLRTASKEAGLQPVFPTYDEYRDELDKELY